MFQAESYEGYKLCRKGDLVINSLWASHRGLGISENEGIVSTAYSVLKDLESLNNGIIDFLTIYFEQVHIRVNT